MGLWFLFRLRQRRSFSLCNRSSASPRYRERCRGRTRSLTFPSRICLMAFADRLLHRSMCRCQWNGSNVLFVESLMSVPHRLQVTSTGPCTSTRGSDLSFCSRAAERCADRLMLVAGDLGRSVKSASRRGVFQDAQWDTYDVVASVSEGEGDVSFLELKRPHRQ